MTTQKKIDELLAASEPFARDGLYERYKTSNFFDGTVQNPSWLG